MNNQERKVFLSDPVHCVRCGMSICDAGGLTEDGLCAGCASGCFSEEEMKKRAKALIDWRH